MGTLSFHAIIPLTFMPPEDNTRVWDRSVNGKALNPGVFAYKAIILYHDGSSKIEYGDVTLVR